MAAVPTRELRWQWHFRLLVNGALCDRLTPGDATCMAAATWLRTHRARPDGTFANPADARWYDLCRGQEADALYWALSSPDDAAADLRDAQPVFEVIDGTRRDQVRAEAQRRCAAERDGAMRGLTREARPFLHDGTLIAGEAWVWGSDFLDWPITPVETRRAPDGVPWDVRGAIRPWIGTGLFLPTVWLSPWAESWRHVTAEGRLRGFTIPVNHLTTAADVTVMLVYSCLDLTSWEVFMMYRRYAHLPVP